MAQCDDTPSRQPTIRHGGCVGLMSTKGHTRHQHEDAQSDTGGVDSEIDGDPSWPDQPSVRGELMRQIEDLSSLWKNTAPTLSYKRIWWEDELFNIAIYGFGRTPFIRQILRLLLHQT